MTQTVPTGHQDENSPFGDSNQEMSGLSPSLLPIIHSMSTYLELGITISCSPNSKLPWSMPSQTADTGALRAGLGKTLDGASFILESYTLISLLQLTLYSSILGTGGKVWLLKFDIIDDKLLEQFLKAVINSLWDCFYKSFYINFQPKQLRFWALEKMFFLKIWISISINQKLECFSWLRLTANNLF